MIARILPLALAIFSVAAQGAASCANPAGGPKIHFSLSSLEARVEGKAPLKCRESQATSAFFCSDPASLKEDNFQLVVNLSRDREPVSARLLSGDQPAMPCREEGSDNVSLARALH